MPELPIEQILQLGSTTVVSVIAILALAKIIQNKKNNNKEFLKELKENHLKGMETKLDNLEYMGRETDKKLEKIILILTRIEEKFKK